jgi:hypothetical protein
MCDLNPFALDAFTVMQNANRLHNREHRELLAAHNVNCCDGEDSWFDETEDDLTTLDEVEAFNTFWMDNL